MARSVLPLSLLVVACMALSACSGGGLFGQGAGRATGVSTAPSDTGVGDPTSPAFFQSSVGDRVLFAVDQSSLTPGAQSTLTAQARWLAANPQFSAIIEGHADEQGTREYNLALGARRANSVQEFLIGQGVAATRLRTITYGKERPLEVCSEESCYAQNRRAVTVLQAGAGAGT